ncbi:MAG: exodeoxyribonuclease III [Deltaproteobacteria bacterium]|nr:exodeoxyribonuclease III [Deltaproteobacteria bacterium]
MKIACFNANGIRARMPIVLEWLEKESPDALCVQETKVQDPDFPHRPFEDMGYHCSFKGQKSYNGVAVLSKVAPTVVETGFGDGDEKERPRIIRVCVDGINIVNTYVPQGRDPDSDMFRYKLDWFGRLRKYFDDNFNSEDRVIWTGDFNVAPLPMDVYDPEKLLGSIGFHPEEHQALSNVMEWGFVDIYRLHKPEEKAFTFWDYRIPNAVKRGLGWRIDHICASQVLANRSKNAWIDIEPRRRQKPSDHTFIVAAFDLEVSGIT